MINNLKLLLKLIIRNIRDLYNGNYYKFAKIKKQVIDFKYNINIVQDIKPSESFENKVYNLKLASNIINQVIIYPDEIFSFWKIIKNPNLKFKKSRVISKGIVSEENGGGLCQISGIIYHLSLISGLDIIERYNHSIDIYTDETRFTSLGLDATVVYGYKDFRVKNSSEFPLKFELNIVNNQLIVSLLSTQEIIQKELMFEVETNNNSKIVKIYEKEGELISTSLYNKK